MRKAKQPSRGKLDDLANEWERSLSARDLSTRTAVIYLGALDRLRGFLLAQGLSTDVADITREHMRTYLERRWARSRRPRCRSPTAHTAPSSSGAWPRTCSTARRWTTCPGPKAVVPMVPFLSDAQMRAPFAACAGKGFTEVRDLALLRLFVDTGVRRAEMAGLKLEDLDMGQRVAFVVGKGRRPRIALFGNHTATALDRYLRQRRGHDHLHLPWVWIGTKGRVTDSGLTQIITRRARLAGVGHVHAHMFRHSFASSWLSQGGNEGDLMQLLGWKSRAMVDRYGSATAAARAREAHRRFAPGDRL
jgi:site-specific recombinase XerD